MLLRWLAISLAAFGAIVGRTRAYLDPAAKAARAGRRGRGRGRARRGSPSPPPRLPPPPGSDPRVACLSGGITFVAEALAVFRWTEVGARAQQVHGALSVASVLALIFVMMILVPGLAPRFFRRHHLAVQALTRLGFFALPILRDPQDVQWVLRSQPSQRALGLVADLFMVTLGVRGLAVGMAPLVCPVPLLPHLALTVHAVHRVRTTAHMCGPECPFLRHDIWRRRIAWLHRVMGALPLLAPDAAALAPLGDPASPGGTEPACRVFLAALQLVLAVVLPTLMLAKLYAPLAAAKAAAAAERGVARRRSPTLSGGSISSGGSGERQRRQQQRQQPQRLWQLWQQRLRDAAQRCWRQASAAAEAGEAAALYTCQVLLNGVGSPLLTACAWWALASCVWNAALLLEMPQYALRWPDAGATTLAAA